ncbi:glycosyltransferase [uncultured Tateyamaria sp.]|uniref:glycosyltransferase family 2 protein n=1 Tax=uncultured Tateyamaria sp. TaxID=455651 RepID=UPI0026382F2C|nr:glycosyltransferase [uncultured Tateyamaria sp.]
MTHPPVSVVVVSRDRPDALRRCLTGLLQVQYSPFEVVVVADKAGRDAIADFAGQIKIVPFEDPNISVARNLGISHAAGDIVAFIDDDAVPEPSWLGHLIAPAEQRDVAAMGGFVRGRNGISFQWRARSVDATGETQNIPLETDQTVVLTPRGARATKTEGTNMAVRRDVLVDLEGFDPGFAFFLDETDLNLRLAKAGHATALVPMAEVHHGFAASPRRRPDRVPRDLFDIGASWGVFQRKHMPQDTRAAHWHKVQGAERARLLHHMVSGRLLPGDVTRLMRRLNVGYAEGQTRARGGAQIARSPMSAFLPVVSQPRQSIALKGRFYQRAPLREEAARRAEAGEIVTLILLSPTALYHHVRFDPRGFWEQRGGLFGKSERTDALVRPVTFQKRCKQEVARVAAQRLIFT